MPSCICCGERVSNDRTDCPICGTKIPPSALSPEEYRAEAPLAPRVGIPIGLARGSSFCPSCAKTYAPGHQELFCECGTELARAGEPKTAAPSRTVASPFPPPKRPPPGTRCIVLYGPDKEARQYYPIEKDVTLIGRLDALDGVFPDINLSDYLDKEAARRVSRRHALVLYSRATASYTLRPLAGNTGTQIGADMVAALEDYPLEPGTRIVLGGAVRLKFEVT